jgi:hypothetical protein
MSCFLHFPHPRLLKGMVTVGESALKKLEQGLERYTNVWLLVKLPHSPTLTVIQLSQP